MDVEDTAGMSKAVHGCGGHGRMSKAVHEKRSPGGLPGLQKECIKGMYWDYRRVSNC